MHWIIILAGFFLTRLINLNLIPVFADEAIYIRWSQLIGDKFYNFFIPLSDGKTPLFMWLLAPLLKLNYDPLLTGRLLSVFAGLLTLSGTYLLTRKLFSPKAALIAVVLAVFCPFLLFYDRLSLTDSLLTALIVWSAYLVFQPGIKLGLAAAASLLVKPSALIYLGLISLFNLKAWKKLLVSGLIALVIYNLQRFSNLFYMINQRSADYLRPPQLDNFINTGRVFFDWLLAYLSWPAIIFFLICLIWAIKIKQRQVLILTSLIILPFFALAAVGKIVYPRYLLPIIPFLIIILSWGISSLKKYAVILLLAILLPWLRLGWQILTNPVGSTLHQAEKEQYFYSWAAGYGLKEVAHYLNALPKDQSILVATEGSFGTLPDGLKIYFSQSKQIEISGVGFPVATITPGMEASLQAGKKVFLLVNFNRYNLSQTDRLKLIAEYPRLSNEKLVFYEVH